MASTKELFEGINATKATLLSHSASHAVANVSTVIGVFGAVHKNARSESGCPETNTIKIVNTRNAIIALIIMLILLITMQMPVCCDGVITSELMLPPAQQQPLRPAQALSLPTRTTSTGPVTLKPGPVKVRPDKVVAATETQLKLASLAPASGPVQSIPDMEQDIKTDAAASLIAVNTSGFVKIADTGDQLDDIASQWECVEDRANQLTWEVKKNDGGIRDRDHSYSWFNSNNSSMPDGTSNGGRCKGGVSCDTSGYIQAINQQKLCGFSDWRLPTRAELETLVDYSSNSAHVTINSDYFPQAIPSWYWTASENPHREGYAWYVLFRNGVALNDLKERPKHIRLVRGEFKQ